MKKILSVYNTILALIQAVRSEVSAVGLFELIVTTSGLKTPTLVVLHNYSSDKSNNTELADYTLNVNTKYDNALESSAKKIDSLDIADIVAIQANCTPEKIKGFQFIDRKGMTSQEYCTAVKVAIPQAIEEMKVVTPRPADNVIHINNVLSFNTNTGNLLIKGELVKGGKSVSIQGEVKVTAKGAKTVAKELVKEYLNTRTSKIRTFAITNLNYISIGGKKIGLVIE